ncbi:MAG: hypothetical protein HXY40_06410 [Chloroflexi bacterium]|nr:hypothetical protein [Chloroflexota bacterium]
MAAEILCWLAGLLLLSGCAVWRTELPARVALLASFEGRYREVGYNAFYAVRLALADAALEIEFLPVDDGGTAESAQQRARALAVDPQVRAVLLLGYHAAAAETQLALDDLPAIVVGHWSAQPARAGVFMLAAQALDTLITAPARIDVTDAAELASPVTGGDVFALAQFPLLRDRLDGVTIVSSARLPDADFAARYRASAQFAPAPGLLAMLAYDAAALALQVTDANTTRAQVSQRLGAVRYEGLNGLITFENGYWADAPIYYYAYDQRRLLAPVDRVIEQR